MSNAATSAASPDQTAPTRNLTTLPRTQPVGGAFTKPLNNNNIE